MKKSISLIVIALIVGLFFLPFLTKGLLPIPLDTIIGLYHPYRDLYAPQFPNGIPFKNFLITDPVRQLYPWRFLAMDMLGHLELPLWNPYSFSGTPLLANFQSAVWYPLNLFYLVLPFSLAWSIQVLLQPLLAASFLYLYLRKMKLHQVASLMGGITFAFSGFSIAWLEWNSVLQTLLWLPLILYIKETLLSKFTWKWGLALIAAEISCFFAGHLQVWFYAMCVSNVYLWLRIGQVTWSEKRSFIKWVSLSVKKYLPFLGIGIVVLIIPVMQWLPTFQFIGLSARGIDQIEFLKEGWFVPWQNLIQFVAPDFFGNPTTLNYWGVWNYAEFVGYIGIVPLLFVLFALFTRHDKKTYFWGGVLLVSLLFAFPTVLAYIPYQLHVPLLSTSQPTRLMGIIDLALGVLTALGIDHYSQKKNKILAPVVVMGTIYAILWIVVTKHIFGIAIDNALTAKRNLIFPSVLFIISGIALLLQNIFSSHKRIVYGIFFFLFCIAIFDLLRFGNKFTPFTSPSYLYPKTKAITFLQNNIGNYRYMSLDSQIFAPNFSGMYKLQSVEGYDPLYLQRYGEFIIAMEREKPDIHSPFGFNRIITPHNSTNRFIDLLGVKYILSLSDVKSDNFKKVFEEGEAKIYQNNRVLPRAFFVKSTISVHSKQEAIDTLFRDSNSLQENAVVENLSNSQTFQSLGRVTITSYTANKIILATQSNSDGFLVLTDIYYPTWHATIDEKETRIFLTDFTFRGIFVPKGHHVIAFHISLF